MKMRSPECAQSLSPHDQQCRNQRNQRGQRNQREEFGTIGNPGITCTRSNAGKFSPDPDIDSDQTGTAGQRDCEQSDDPDSPPFQGDEEA